MSASPTAKQATESRSIPSKRILIQDPNQLPHDYSSTPGGTLYSTTPGGTRIVYERAFLMNLRNSPLSRTPPCNMPLIPTELLKNTSATTISMKPPASKGIFVAKLMWFEAVGHFMSLLTTHCLLSDSYIHIYLCPLKYYWK